MTSGLAPPPWFAALQQGLSADPAALAASYQRLFMPRPPAAVPATSSPGALRLQRASQKLAELAVAVAADASERFQAALASTDPTLAKITSLRALHELWIDCGEAAHAAAAHAPAWAQAQAELLNALVDLRAESAGAAR